MAKAGDGVSASGLRGKECTVASPVQKRVQASRLGTCRLSAMCNVSQLEGTDLEQDGAIMGPACCFLCPSGALPIPVPHTWNVCVPRALLLSTGLSLLSPCDDLGYHLSFIPSLGSKAA